MAKQGVKLTGEQIDKIFRLRYGKGLSYRKIGARVGCSNNCARRYIWMFEHGADKSTAYMEDRALKRDFPSLTAYLNWLAERQPEFSSRGEYRKFNRLARGETYFEQFDRRAKQRGHDSAGEYRIKLERERQKRPQNKALSRLIKAKLWKMGKSQKWLAGELGVSQLTVNRYALGKNIPEPDRLQQIFQVLGVPFETLDDLMGTQNGK